MEFSDTKSMVPRRDTNRSTQNSCKNEQTKSMLNGQLNRKELPEATTFHMCFSKSKIKDLKLKINFHALKQVALERKMVESLTRSKTSKNITPLSAITTKVVKINLTTKSSRKC
jgi:hypothetical protein